MMSFYTLFFKFLLQLFAKGYRCIYIQSMRIKRRFNSIKNYKLHPTFPLTLTISAL